MIAAAYYNECDKVAAAWLGELIKEGLIAPGYVDTREIQDVTPADLRGFVQCHFFAGIGVWSKALRDAGWPDNRPVWTGSCPCQPFSAAGKGGGFDDERHLWPAWHWLIEQCRPYTIFGEQVASKHGLAWFDLVSADLEGSGYTVGASDLCAAGVGAPHIRQRLWFVGLADTYGDGREAGGAIQPIRAKPNPQHGGSPHRPGPTNGYWRDADWLLGRDSKWRPVEPSTFPLADGSPARMGRLRGYGNSIVKDAAQAFIVASLMAGVAR